MGVSTLCVVVFSGIHSLLNGYSLGDPGLFINIILMLILAAPWPRLAYLPLFALRFRFSALPEEKRVPLTFLFHATMAGLFLLLLSLYLHHMAAASPNNAEVAGAWSHILVPSSIISGIVGFSLSAFNYPCKKRVPLPPAPAPEPPRLQRGGKSVKRLNPPQ